MHNCASLIYRQFSSQKWFACSSVWSRKCCVSILKIIIKRLFTLPCLPAQFPGFHLSCCLWKVQNGSWRHNTVFRKKLKMLCVTFLFFPFGSTHCSVVIELLFRCHLFHHICCFSFFVANCWIWLDSDQLQVRVCFLQLLWQCCMPCAQKCSNNMSENIQVLINIHPFFFFFHLVTSQSNVQFLPCECKHYSL